MFDFVTKWSNNCQKYYNSLIASFACNEIAPNL